MEHHEKWAVAIAGGYLAAPIVSALFFATAAGPHFGWLSFLAQHVGLVIVHAMVAVWLFRTANAQGHSGWSWAATSMAFGILAAVLYFLLRALPDRDSQSAQAKSRAA